MNKDLINRLLKRAYIRRHIPGRKSVQEGKPDRIADILEEAAIALQGGGEILLDKEYCAEDLGDVSRDTDECLECLTNCTRDEHGFEKGTYRVTVVYKEE